MKKLSLLFVLLITLSFLNLHAQDDPMKKWMDSMTPGDAQKSLAMMAGNWNVKTTLWMDPSSAPMVVDGTAKFEMILGDRYLKMTANSVMMGMPFEGIGIFAYDNTGKTYQSTWIDNMGTGVLYMEGTMDPSTKVVTYMGSMVDPMTGVKTTEKMTMTHNSPDKIVQEMFTVNDGKEVKTMENVYTK